MRSSTLAAVVLLFLAGGVSAQEQEAAPPMIAVSYYQCLPDQVGPIVEAWSATFQQMQDDGLVMGWGVLQHAWADEWNLVVYRVIPDLSGLQASMEAQGAVMDAVDPDLGDRMTEACNRQHKDNIYWLTASSEPAEGG